MKYHVPYELMRNVKRPLNMPSRGYVRIKAQNTAQAVCEAKRVINRPVRIEVSKIVEGI